MQLVEFSGIDDVGKALDLVALRRRQWFTQRLKAVRAVSNEGFFATFNDGTIYVSAPSGLI